ncbi:MAG: hypothetical protein ACTSQP_21255 [Promethearchaeota archaeon]
MIVWITTVGWSAFAVINPLWAYCKKYKDFPNKIILIHTPNNKIDENLDICKRYIKEILETYNGAKFNKNQIIEEKIENDSFKLYANVLKEIILKEISQKPKKIILDTTPGRKYMSALNVIYALKIKDIPIQALYLYLYENIYQNIPYPLTPIIKNDLFDIMKFSFKFEENNKNER